MTEDMLALARENQKKANAENVEFLKGEIEAIPLPDSSVDVIISICVINLSADKDKVLREAFRVLKPGGRFAVSDVVTRGAILDEVRRSLLLWVGCIAGALDEKHYRMRIAATAFEAIGIEPTRLRCGRCPRIPDKPERRCRCRYDCRRRRRQIHERVRPGEEAVHEFRWLLRRLLPVKILSRRLVAEALGTRFLVSAT
jgi:SAM-dependent methyltransferase